MCSCNHIWLLYSDLTICKVDSNKQLGILLYCSLTCFLSDRLSDVYMLMSGIIQLRFFGSPLI